MLASTEASTTIDGCLHIAITADSVDPGRVSNVEVWRDAEVLDNWRSQADAPDLDGPQHVAMKRYERHRRRSTALTPLTPTAVCAA